MVFLLLFGVTFLSAHRGEIFLKKNIAVNAILILFFVGSLFLYIFVTMLQMNIYI